MPYTRTLNHKIWTLAWPMIISNLSVPLLSLADTAILGHLETAHYLAAVAIGGSLLSFIYWGFGFLRMGTTGFAAQAYGANDHQASHQLIAQCLIIGFSLGLVLLIVSPWLIQLGLSLIPAPEGTEHLATSYCQIRVFSAPAVLINYGIIGWFIGHQNTRWPLLIALFTNVLNIILDLYFIIGLNLNSDGAAWATLIAEYSGCGLALWVMLRKLRVLKGKVNRSQLWRWSEYRSLFIVNRHLFVRTLVLLASFTFFTAQGARQGELILAANAMLLQLVLLASFGLDGFAHATEALIGKAIGQVNHSQFLRICYQCLQWSALTALGFSLFFYLSGSYLLMLLSSIPTVVNQAEHYLPWLIALPLLAMWSYLLDGIFIGATQSQAMQNSMLFSVVLVYLPCWYFTQQWGNHGLWFAFTAFNTARGISLGYYYFQFNRQQRWYKPHL